jgi:exo-beta-1,3-glucanase (GH17 family)
LGKIDCAGQTNAGQRAELEIAAAIVSQLENLLGKQPQKTLSAAPDSAFFQKLKTLRWICYAPTHFNPNAGLMPADSSVEADLVLLKKAGFSGLVTYGCDGVLGKSLPMIAQKCGFEGLILGIWSPQNPEELQNARAAAEMPIVTAFCVGNEGLDVRYDLETLAAAIDSLRHDTGKPVATTEQVEDYTDPDLLHLGDWVFPNVHPYWHKIHEPAAAVAWTAEQSNSLAARSKRFVLLKEVGFPSAGDDAHRMSEQTQAEYYRRLEKSGTSFCYFEAFDGPWKNWEPVEPFWGLFRADRSPKLVAQNLPR